MNCNTTHYRANSSSVPGDPTLQPLLAAARRHPEQTLRWIDHLGRTVASSDPAEAPGRAWPAPSDIHGWERVPERPDGTRRSLLGISPRYVTHESLDTLSGHVVLETPAPVIRAALAPQALAGLAAFVTGLVVLVLTLRRLNARFESALIEAGRAAEVVSQGDLQASPATQALGRSLLHEARELGARLEEMRTRLAARVERGQRQLSHALEAGHAGAWTVLRMPSGELQMSWSPEMFELVGVCADDFTPNLDDAIQLIDPSDRDAIGGAAREAFAQARAFDFTFRLTRPGDRRPRYLRASCRVEPLSGGGLRWEGMLQDVTEEALRERLLASESTILEQVALGAPLPQIFEALCHSLEERLDGVTASILQVKVGGGVLLEGAGPSLPAAYRQALGEIPIGPRVGSCGTAAFRREPVLVDDIAASPLWEGYHALAAEHRLAACWSYPVLAADGEVLGTFALYAPTPGPPPERVRVSLERATQLARIAMERERNRLTMLGTQERLRQSERLGLLGQIVGGVSHEVRNPLFALSASVDALQAHGVGSGTTGRLLVNIRREVDRIGRLMNDLLEYGRPHPLSLAPVEAASLLAEVVAQTSRLAAERGVTVDVEVAADLRLTADNTQLASALRNVVENAVFHSPAGSRVELRAQAARGRVRFEVLDRGPGLREDELGHVFEPFFTNRRGGTGLGLAIVRHVVERHQGRVTLVNRAGGGACATIDLPAVAAAAAPALAPAGEPSSGG